MTRASPKCCPACGSLAIIRLEDMDNCQRCGAKRKSMRKLHAANGRSDPEDRGYARMHTDGGGLGTSGSAYMKRRHLSGGVGGG
jgi:hypothetical protein